MPKLPDYLTPTPEEVLTGEAAAIARKARGMLAIHFPEGFTRFDGASVELHEVDFVVFDKLSAPVILALPPGMWEQGAFAVNQKKSSWGRLVIDNKSGNPGPDALYQSYSIALTRDFFRGAEYHLSGCAKLGAEGSYAGLPRLAVHPDGESERETYSFGNASFAVFFVGMQTGEMTPGNYFDALVVEA